MNRALRKRFRLKLGLLLVTAIFAQSADVARCEDPLDCLAEMTHHESLNQAVLKVANARMALENWRLGQLKLLRGRGHASWLEVARQQLVTDTLRHRRAAIAEFRSFHQSLRQRVRLAAGAAQRLSTMEQPPSTAPLKLTAPGSIRLIAWIEPGQLPPENHSRLAARAQTSSAPAEGERQLELAQAKLRQAEKRCQVYASLNSTSEPRRRQAELLRSLARAEAQLCQIKIDLQHSRRIEQRSTRDVAADTTAPTITFANLPFGEIEPYLTPQSNPHLELATLRVARSEAVATGELQAAKVDWQQCKLRWEVLKSLSQKGFAHPQELNEARVRLENSERRVQRLQQAHVQRRESCRRLESELAAPAGREKSPTDVEGISPPELIKAEEFPLSLATDLHVVRHVTELRRSYLVTLSQRRAGLLKIAMLEAHSNRLERSLASQPESTLLAGSRRQLADLQLEIRHVRAIAQAARERLEILAAEQQRFVQQCVAQQQAENRSTLDPPALSGPVANSGAWALHLVSLVQPQHLKNRSTRISYFESDYFARPESWQRCDLASMATVDSWFDFGREDRHLSRATRTGLHRNTSLDARISCRRSPHRLVSYDTILGSNSSTLRKPGSARLITTSSVYPFGILRSDLQSQLTPGQPPWYLPGSPTNLRPRKQTRP